MKELALHILDIVNNSITARATHITIAIEENLSRDSYLIKVIDNGKGIEADMIDKVTDPFITSRTTRKVGLGLSLLKQNAERTGGYLRLESTPGKGTTVECCLGLSNFDRPAIGDISGVVAMLAGSFTDIDFVYSHQTDVGQYLFDTKEIKNALDGVPITDPSVRRFLVEMIDENLAEIKIIR
jgi:hypothetical protein